MTTYKEKCGYTRSMYPPAKKGEYIIKDMSDNYFIALWDGNKWIGDYSHIIAWSEFNKTDIDTPF